MLNAEGEQYIPYGINIVGLAHALDAHTVWNDERQIRAAATSWCANTVRLQVSEDRLVTTRGGVHKRFLAAVEAEVSFARSLGLLVALNLQHRFADEYMPTAKSKVFWGLLASLYKGDPEVIFDLFNEPRKVGSWSFWRNGGVRGRTRYYGMQQLASFIRSKGAHNLLWIEGPHTGGSLRLALEYRLHDVSPFMYDVHRPPQPNTVRRWRKSFGYLAQEHKAPVLDGEWADYARPHAWWACWNNAPVSVPKWLRYLADNQIGLIASKLVKGELVRSNNLNDPTRFKANWACKTGLDQGAGSLIKRFFERQNGPTLYAAASSRGADDCFTAQDACKLSTAIREADAGDTIELVTSGNEGSPSTWYRGGFKIKTTGTSASLPLKIEPAPGVKDPIIDGGKLHTVFSVGDVYLDLTGMTIQDGKGTFGGGITNRSGGTVVVTRSTFSSNTASSDGGAIDNGDNGGTGTLTVTSSTFSGNDAHGDGGAIDNGDNGGTAVATVAADIFAGTCAQVSGTWTDDGYNVGSDGSCLNRGTGDRSSLRAGYLGLPADNGGGIETMLPLKGNPAIGIVPDPTEGLCPTTDERGTANTEGGPCTAGSVQGSGKVPRPAVVSVSPASGPVTGGTRVTIRGSNFLPGAKVFIGQGGAKGKRALLATQVRVVSQRDITAVTPAGKRGTWVLYVADAGRTSAANQAVRFAYK